MDALIKRPGDLNTNILEPNMHKNVKFKKGSMTSQSPALCSITFSSLLAWNRRCAPTKMLTASSVSIAGGNTHVPSVKWSVRAKMQPQTEKAPGSSFCPLDDLLLSPLPDLLTSWPRPALPPFHFSCTRAVCRRRPGRAAGGVCRVSLPWSHSAD